MKKPIEYTIEPAKGQALLKFAGRRMPDKIELFETALIEEVRQNGQKKLHTDTELNADFRNLLIHGDCLSACAYLKSQNIKVDLIYIDPPFASGANYAKKIYLRNGGKSSIKNDDNSIGEEIMYGDIWQKEDYLNWLYERLLAIKEVMSETASIYVHLDWHIGHYVKILMDEIFGEENLVNEIIWNYISGGISDKFFARKHDNLFFYTKSIDTKYTFNIQKERKKIVQKEKILKDEKGEFIWYIRPNTNPAVPQGVKSYLDKFVQDVWQIPIENPQAEVRTEYLTQKPEALLERFIKASSNESMIIADFFVGSGTTAKVSNNMGRKFIACDIGINAVQTTRDRLTKAKAEFDILKINDGVRLFRNPAQTTAKLFSLLDGYKDRMELELSEFWDGGMVNKRGTFTPVKFVGIDKKLTKELVDVIIEEVIPLEDTHQEEIQTQRGTEDKIPAVKIIYAYKETGISQEYVNKAVRSSGKTTIKAELVGLDELLAQKADALYTPDNAIVEIKKEVNYWKVEIKKYFSSYLKNKIDDFNAKKTKAKQKTIDENGENGNGNGEENATAKPKIKISESGLELIEAVQFDTTLRKDGVWTSNLGIEDKAGIKEKIKAVYKLPTDNFKMKIRNIAGDEIIIDSEELR